MRARTSVAAYTWLAQQREDIAAGVDSLDDQQMELRLEIAAEVRDLATDLLWRHCVLARQGDEEAVAWLHSERFRRCCRVLGHDPDALRAGILDHDPEGPDAPVGAMLRDPDAMRRLVADGMNVRDISQHLGVPRATVHRWLRRHGITTKRARRARPTDEPAREAA